LRPTPERYAEIQGALAKAGYFQGSANGVWGQSSVSALAKFQQDNGLEQTGKIDAQSLIKLNLGPKYEGNTALVSTGAAPSGQ
jgi:peptidoglycan hydrolase-like protein with peptidoglycan-binding domain